MFSGYHTAIINDLTKKKKKKSLAMLPIQPWKERYPQEKPTTPKKSL